MNPGEVFEHLSDGRYAFRVDHHTINDYNTCEQYFNFRHVPDSSGKVWSTKGVSFKISVGSWWSSVMEALYREMSLKNLPDEKTLFRFVNDCWAHHQMDVYQTLDPKNYDKFGGIDGAREMALKYYLAFAKQHFQSWTIIGAELGFGMKNEILLSKPDDDVVVYYTGRPDLMLVDNVQHMAMPLDFKTKDTVPSNTSVIWKPHPQTAGYIWSLNELIKDRTDLKPCTKCIIMVCGRFRPTDKPRDGIIKPRFMPVYVNYDQYELEEWRRGVVEKCRRLRDSIVNNFWPKRESACHLYYHGCAFRRVCSITPAMREATLSADFIKSDPWTPYEPEED